MKIADALNTMEELRPGTAVTPEKMKRWLNTLDLQVWEELIQRRVPDKNTPAVFDGYTENTDENTQLLIPDPDAEDIYTLYLSMKIDLFNQEMEGYINSASLFNAAYEAYSKKYARQHRQRSSYCYRNN